MSEGMKSPRLPPRPSCFSAGPPDSHVAAEVMVGGRKKDPMKSTESKPRDEHGSVAWRPAFY